MLNARSALILLAVALTSFSCVDGEEQNTDQATLKQALCPPAGGYGDSGPFSFTASDGNDYNYFVYVPTTYDHCNGDFPLVLNFHGGGQTALEFQDKEFMHDLRTHADSVGAVLIWINADTNLRLWNAGHCCSTRDHVLMVDEFVSFTHTKLHIDPDRIHATGFSNGGMFAQYLAASLPDVFASVASVAGAGGSFVANAWQPCSTPYTPGCYDWNPLETVWGTLPPPASDVAVFMIRGSEDQNVPVDGDSVTSPRIHYLPAVYNPDDLGASDYELWSDATGCNTTSVQYFAGVGDSYLCEGGGRKVRHDIVHHMGHFWPRDVAGGSNYANYDGAQEVASFLWNNPK